MLLSHCYCFPAAQDAQDPYYSDGDDLTANYSQIQRSQKKKYYHRDQEDDGSVSSAGSATIHNARKDKENRRYTVNMGPPRTRGSKAKLPTNKQQGVEDTQPEPEVQNAEAEEQKKLAEENAKLKALLLASQTPVSTNKAKSWAKMTSEEKRYAKTIQDWVRLWVWPSLKFCSTDEKLAKITAYVFDKCKAKDFAHLTKDADKEAAKVKWVAENSDIVRQGLNELRNSAQANLRGWVVDERMQKGLSVPTKDEIYWCATRYPQFSSRSLVRSTGTRTSATRPLFPTESPIALALRPVLLSARRHFW